MKDDVSQLFTPPKKEKLHESIVAQIKSLIQSKRLDIGDKLPSERDLAKSFQVSRVVIRESLRSLEQSGLIEIRAGSNGGAYISFNLHKPLFDAAFNLYGGGKEGLKYFLEARHAIECFTVRLAAEKVTSQGLETLRKINANLLRDIGDKSKLRENNGAFHVAVAEMSGNPLLVLMMRSLLQILDVVLPKSVQSDKYVRDTYERHEAIIKAMEEKAFDRCEELMAIDLEHTVKLRLPEEEE